MSGVFLIAATVMVSFGYPYMLYDAPRVPAYVNAYANTETMRGIELIRTVDGELFAGLLSGQSGVWFKCVCHFEMMHRNVGTSLRHVHLSYIYLPLFVR